VTGARNRTCRALLLAPCEARKHGAPGAPRTVRPPSLPPGAADDAKPPGVVLLSWPAAPGSIIARLANFVACSRRPLPPPELPYLWALSVCVVAWT
jgi:hypothetical protein